MTEADADRLFHALAHETRRAILDLVRDRPGQGVGELARAFDVSRIAVMNHLAVLEAAGLILSQKDGRTRRLYLNAAPIQMIHDRWISDFSGHWANKVTALKYAAEAAARKRGEPHE
ncbi:MAG: metalloregulator ArsR/SmtB family transcription factor [Alphaproteobacteria bacterium]|nr:metalloregulator ArsR/SmtB family transcription factor [Alphaproteobacteria bacterium]